MKNFLTIALAPLAVFGGAAYSADTVAKDAAPHTLEHISCTGAANEIRIIVKDVRRSTGLIVADLYRNDPEGFLKRDGRVQQVRFAAKAPHTAFCMRAPEPERYAVALYHDKNANKTLDKGAFGIPNEPYGVSNNPTIRLRAPRIDESTFEVAPEGATVEIKLNN